MLASCLHITAIHHRHLRLLLFHLQVLNTCKIISHPVFTSPASHNCSVTTPAGYQPTASSHFKDIAAAHLMFTTYCSGLQHMIYVVHTKSMYIKIIVVVLNAKLSCCILSSRVMVLLILINWWPFHGNSWDTAKAPFLPVGGHPHAMCYP